MPSAGPRQWLNLEPRAVLTFCCSQYGRGIFHIIHSSAPSQILITTRVSGNEWHPLVIPQYIVLRFHSAPTGGNFKLQGMFRNVWVGVGILYVTLRHQVICHMEACV